MELSKPDPLSKALLRKLEDILFPVFGHAQCFISFNTKKVGCFMKWQYFFGCLLGAASLAVWPEISLAHGGGGGGEAVMVGEAAVTDLAGDFMVASPVTAHSVWEGTQ